MGLKGEIGERYWIPGYGSLTIREGAGGLLGVMNALGVGKLDIGRGNVTGGIRFAMHAAGKDMWRRVVIKGPGSDRETPGVAK